MKLFCEQLTTLELVTPFPEKWKSGFMSSQSCMQIIDYHVAFIKLIRQQQTDKYSTYLHICNHDKG